MTVIKCYAVTDTLLNLLNDSSSSLETKDSLILFWEYEKTKSTTGKYLCSNSHTARFYPRTQQLKRITPAGLM